MCLSGVWSVICTVDLSLISAMLAKIINSVESLCKNILFCRDKELGSELPGRGHFSCGFYTAENCYFFFFQIRS